MSWKRGAVCPGWEQRDEDGANERQPDRGVERECVEAAALLAPERLVEAAAAFPSDAQPNALFTLALVQDAPSEMRQGLVELWSHLEADCAGWVGVGMWADRWRAASQLGDRLAARHRELGDQLRARLALASDDNDLDAQERRIGQQRAHITRAVGRAVQQLRGEVATQQRMLLAEIVQLSTRRGLFAYLEGGHAASMRRALDAVQEVSRRQGAIIAALHPAGSALSAIALDRRLLGLDDTTQSAARDRLSGPLYWVARTWELLAPGPWDLTAGNLEAARAVLRNEVHAAVTLLSLRVGAWVRRAEQVERDALADLRERSDGLVLRRQDSERFKADLVQRLQAHDRVEPEAERLAGHAHAFEAWLQEIRDRGLG